MYLHFINDDNNNNNVDNCKLMLAYSLHSLTRKDNYVSGCAQCTSAVPDIASCEWLQDAFLIH